MRARFNTNRFGKILNSQQLGEMPSISEVRKG